MTKPTEKTPTVQSFRLEIQCNRCGITMYYVDRRLGLRSCIGCGSRNFQVKVYDSNSNCDPNYFLRCAPFFKLVELTENIDLTLAYPSEFDKNK